MRRPKALYILDADAYDLAYGPESRRLISAGAEIFAPPMTRLSVLESPHLLEQVEVIFSGWGAPVMDRAFLSLARRLKAVFYAAGSLSGWATDELFSRQIRVSNAIYANSVPVAEYTLATILISLKHGWRLNRETVRQRRFVERNGAPGSFRSVVGILSIGVIGRLVVQLLKPFDLTVLVSDPFVSEADAASLGVTKVSLQTLFSQSDVVSVHTALNENTVGLIDGPLLRSMKPGATFINTARGSLIEQSALVDVLLNRPDLQAVLDVCDPEPPEADCPLFDLPNVFLTPHIAGSIGNECMRLGQCMAEDFQRFMRGEPMKYEATRATSGAHVAPPVLVRTFEPKRAVAAR